MNTKELEAGMIASGKNRRQRLQIVYGLLSDQHDANKELVAALRTMVTQLSPYVEGSSSARMATASARAALAKLS